MDPPVLAPWLRWYDVPIMKDLALQWPITRDWLPYHALLEARELSAIDLVVIHCTELPDMAMAREYGERVLHASGAGNSGHYYIDRDGSIHEYVSLERTAHHTRGFNPRSIGIEIVNTGRYPHWYDSRHQAMEEPYSDEQIQALIDLLKALHTSLPGLKFIAGHEDLDTGSIAATDNPELSLRRKCDPGPQFPWPRVLAQIQLTPLPLDSQV